MLRHLIILWLIVSIPGYGLALAADVHDELLPKDTAGYEQPTSDGSTPTDNDCGHCSHGIQHLLGLQNHFSLYTLPTVELLQGCLPAHFTAPIPQAIHRPPIFV